MQTIIPAIHNYYMDLMIGLSYMLDNKIFNPDTIKSYQYNLGNKTFQLDYKPQKEFPMAIVNYESSTLMQYPDRLLHRNTIGNNFTIPIVYNSTKDLHLEIQEAEYEHNITLIINCQSSFQLLELQHIIELKMPVGKFIEIFDFYTFLEVPDYFLNPLMFDVNRDTIYNLFIRRDSLTDTSGHVASVKYDPLVKLNSITSNGFNSDNQSFSLELSLTISNPVPMYFQIPEDETPKIQHSIRDVTIPNVCLPFHKTGSLFKLMFKDTFGEIVSTYIPVIELENNIIESKFKIDKTIYLFRAHILNKNTSYDATIESESFNFPCSISINNNSEVTIGGILNGTIANPKIDSETITGFMSATYDMNDLDAHRLNQAISVTLCPDTKLDIYELENIEINDITNGYSLIPLSYTFIPSTRYDLSTHNYSGPQLTLHPLKSAITSICVYDRTDKIFKMLSGISNIDECGNVFITIDRPSVLDGKQYTDHIQITGHVDVNTNLIDFDINYEQDKCSIIPSYALMCGTFTNLPKYGSTYIRNISIDIAMTQPNSTVYIPNSFKMFSDFNLISPPNSKTMYSICIQNSDEYLLESDDSVYINLMPLTSYSIDCNPNDLDWSLLFKNSIYTKQNTNFELLIYNKPLFFGSLVLKIPIIEYKTKFNAYKTIFDVIFFKLMKPEGILHA